MKTKTKKNLSTDGADFAESKSPSAASVKSADNPVPLKHRIATAPRLNVARGSVRVGSNVRTDVNIDDLLPGIRELGIIQALWVRPLPQYKLIEPDLESDSFRVVLIEGSGHLEVGQVALMEFSKAEEQLAHITLNGWNMHQYELIAGGRRMACAVELDLAEVPVQVFDCTEEEAADLQLLENLDREQLTELDEAKAFRARVDSKRFGPTVEKSVAALAEQFHRSASHIFDRMALLKLSEPALDAFRAGKLDISLAKEITAVPGEKEQKELLKQHEKTPFSVRTLREHIERHHMQPLEDAPFDVMHTTLVTIAGACGPCPKRSGNMVDQFPHLKTRPNVCTDPGCYRLKVNAQREIKLSDYRDSGHRVLSAAESKPLFSHTYLAYQSGWSKANEICEADPKQRTWKQLARLVKDKPVIACDGTGAVVELCEEAPTLEKLYAAKVLKKPKLVEGRGSRVERQSLGLGFAEKEETPEAKAEREFEAAVEVDTERREALEYIGHVEELKGEKDEAVFLRWLIAVTVDGSDMPMEEVLSRRGLNDAQSRNAFDDLGVAQLRGVLMELHVAGYYGLQGNPNGNASEVTNGRALETLAEYWPKLVDRKALAKAVRKELKEKAKEAAVQAVADSKAKAAAETAKHMEPASELLADNKPDITAGKLTKKASRKAAKAAKKRKKGNK